MIYPMALDTVADNEYCVEAFSSVWFCLLFFWQTLVAGDSWGQCILACDRLQVQNAASVWDCFDLFCMLLHDGPSRVNGHVVSCLEALLLLHFRANSKRVSRLGHVLLRLAYTYNVNSIQTIYTHTLTTISYWQNSKKKPLWMFKIHHHILSRRQQRSTISSHHHPRFILWRWWWCERCHDCACGKLPLSHPSVSIFTNRRTHALRALSSARFASRRSFCNGANHQNTFASRQKNANHFRVFKQKTW